MTPRGGRCGDLVAILMVGGGVGTVEVEMGEGGGEGFVRGGDGKG